MAKIVWKRRNVIVVITVVALILTTIHWTLATIFCSDATSRQQIEELCSNYFAGELSGNLCHALCSERSLQFLNCIHLNQGKVVLLMTLNGKSVIMKSEHARINNFLAYNYRKISPKNPLHVPSEFVFKKQISDLIYSRLGKPLDALLTNFPAMQFKFENISDMTTLWLLLQQEEYLIMSYLQGHQSIPELHGNCGYYYVTEFLPPGKHLKSGNLLMTFLPSQWMIRVKIALQLLDIMQAFDMDFEFRFHFCDMKGQNFGINVDGKVKVTDLDSALFETELTARYNHVTCTADEDCDVFDCRGSCFSGTQSCLPLRMNTNIQVLCEKVFVGGIQSNAFLGLLNSPPLSIKSQLREALDRCRNPPIDDYKRTITENCQLIYSQKGNPLSGNSTITISCRKAIEKLQTFLTTESRQSYEQLNKILTSYEQLNKILTSYEQLNKILTSYEQLNKILTSYEQLNKILTSNES